MADNSATSADEMKEQLPALQVKETIRLPTETGEIVIVVQGRDQGRRGTDRFDESWAFITYGDVGLDYATCFGSFTAYLAASGMLDMAQIAHIHAPGQYPGTTCDSTRPYPTLDQLAHHVEVVVDHLHLRQVVCIGAGIGGNVLMRYALQRPKALAGLVLIGSTPRPMGWFEWGYYKLAQWYLRNNGMTSFTVDLLLSSYFSDVTRTSNVDLVEACKHHLSKRVHPASLAAFLDVIMRRDDLLAKVDQTFKYRTMIVCGNHSVHCDDITELNSKLSPDKTSYLSLFNTANLVHEEQPFEVARAIVLFLQGIGLGAGDVLRLSELSQEQARAAAQLSQKLVVELDP